MPPPKPVPKLTSESEIKARITELDNEIKKLKDHRNGLAEEGTTAFAKLKQLAAEHGEAKAKAIITGDLKEEQKIGQEYDQLFERNRTRQSDLRDLQTAIDVRQNERSQLASQYRKTYRAKATTLADEAIPQIEKDIIDAVAELVVLYKCKLGVEADPKIISNKLYMKPEFKQKLAKHRERISQEIGTPL